MLEWIISSAVLTAVVIVLRCILKGRMSLRLQYALWLLVLVRLLVPVSFGSTELSVQNVIDRPAVEAPQTAYPAENVMLNSIPISAPISADTDKSHVYNSQNPLAENQNVRQNAPVSIPQSQPAQGTATIAPAEAAVEAPAGTEPLKVTDILTIVWFSGAGLVALWLLIANLQFYRQLRRSRTPLEGEHAPLPVYVTEKIDTPCLFGLIKPKIYVTPEVAADDTALRYSIEHEATHRRHGDHLWSLLRGACLAVHWYNPLVWVAAILSRSDAELACDEATIRRIGEEHRADYGRTLIQLTCEKRPALFVAATTMTGSGRGIKERIKLIVKKPKTAIYTLIAVVLIVAIAVGCTFTGAKTDDPTEAAETTAPSERAKLEASELPALLDTIDLQRATLTYYYGTEITFPAEATENAEQYFGELKQLAWQDCNMGGFDADDFNGNYVRLTAPHTTVTIYQKGLSQQNLLHVETDNAEGWFQTGSLVIHEDGSQWYAYDNALAWYIEAQGASLYGGNTRILTAEELDYFRELTASTYETYDEETGVTSMHMTEISCFFTSYYTNVRDIDAVSFLWYFPYASYGESIDEAEWQLVQRVLDWRIGEDQHLATREELMVPIHRIPRASVNEVLMKYAGVTVEEMNTDWFTEAIYVPETDCFYTYTSDAGHGTFVPWFGIEHGDQVSLWSRPSLPCRLDLKKNGDDWRIISFAADDLAMESGATGPTEAAPVRYSEEWFADLAWGLAEERVPVFNLAADCYSCYRWEKSLDIVFPDIDGTRSLVVPFFQMESGRWEVGSTHRVWAIGSVNYKDMVAVSDDIRNSEGSDRLAPVIDFARDYAAQMIDYWNEKTGNQIREAEITGLTKVNTGLAALNYEVTLYLLEYRLLPENQAHIALADGMKTEKNNGQTWITEQSGGGQPYLLLVRSTSDEWVRICSLDTAAIERISGTALSDDACRAAASQLFYTLNGTAADKGTLTPDLAVQNLFESGDASLTLWLEDSTQWKTYPLEASYQTRLLDIVDSFDWTPLRSVSFDQFVLEAASADGTKSMSFLPDSGAGTIIYYENGSAAGAWCASQPTDRYSAYRSFIWSVRSIYDSDEADEALYALSFRLDGSAEEVIEYFATTAFVEMNASLAPDSTRRMDELEINGWRMTQGSDDGTEVSGMLWYAYTARGPENIIGPDHEGSGEYEGKIVGSLIVTLQKQEDGKWHVTLTLK